MYMYNVCDHSNYETTMTKCGTCLLHIQIIKWSCETFELGDYMYMYIH